MKRGFDSIKSRLWRERLARFSKAGQTVAQFCIEEGVSVPSFYQWRKKLDPQTRVPGAPGTGVNARPKTGRNRRHLAGSLAGGERPAAGGGVSRRRTRRLGLFRRLELTSASVAATGVTIRLLDGIEIGLGKDLSVIEEVVGQLLEHHRRIGGGGSC